MKRKIIFSVLLVVITSTIIFINNGIKNCDPRFFDGKDGGLLAILKSNSILSSIFFSAMNYQNWAKNLLIGFFIGLLVSILNYFVLIPFHIPFNFELIFQVISCSSFILIYFIIVKVKKKCFRKPNDISI